MFSAGSTLSFVSGWAKVFRRTAVGVNAAINNESNNGIAFFIFLPSRVFNYYFGVF
jgi:hypothetical protein